MIDVLPRYRDFRPLMARQFGDPERIVVAVSKMCAGHYQQYHGVLPGANPPGLSRHRRGAILAGAPRPLPREPLRRQLGIGEDELVFVVRRPRLRRKGLATAIRAVERLAAAGAPVRLLVVGGRRRCRAPAASDGAGRR